MAGENLQLPPAGGVPNPRRVIEGGGGDPCSIVAVDGPVEAPLVTIQVQRERSLAQVPDQGIAVRAGGQDETSVGAENRIAHVVGMPLEHAHLGAVLRVPDPSRVVRGRDDEAAIWAHPCRHRALLVPHHQPGPGAADGGGRRLPQLRHELEIEVVRQQCAGGAQSQRVLIVSLGERLQGGLDEGAAHRSTQPVGVARELGGTFGEILRQHSGNVRG
jgi:hypothetical protein